MTPERKERMLAVINRKQAGLAIVVENVDDPHNVSAVMRSCDAVGVLEIFVVRHGYRGPYKYNSKTAASAQKWLKVHEFDSIEACYEEVRKRYDKIYATHLSKEAVSLYDLDLSPSVALVFGNEHAGLSERAVELADGNFHIPQVGMIRSLNISVACAVSLYEAYRQRAAAGLYEEKKGMSDESREALWKDWCFK